MECKDFRLTEIKADDAEAGVFSGKLSVYDVIDEGGDLVERGAFSKTLQEGGGRVPLLWGHDPKQPIGVLDLTDSPTALLAKGRLVLTVPQAAAAYELLKAGALRGLSIGLRPFEKSQVTTCGD